MKKLLLFIISSCVIKSYGQKSIGELIHAEKSFAAYSFEHGTKAAFLKFLDSSGIIFDQGKPVNGIQSWKKREARPGVLNWYPTTAEVAASGDFGYTTGPWTFQPTLNDSVVARGEFSTIWHKTKNGQWKFLVDLGVTNTPQKNDTSIWRKTYPHNQKKGSIKSMLEAEKKFIGTVERSADTAYNEFMGIQYRLNRNGTIALEGVRKAEGFQKQMQSIVLGSGIASSGDLGYVYGITTINGKKDNYLRVWRNQENGWKIALEVLRY